MAQLNFFKILQGRTFFLKKRQMKGQSGAEVERREDKLRRIFLREREREETQFYSLAG